MKRLLDERLSRLTDLAYAAALDDSLWPAFASASLEEFGGRGGLFSVVDDRGPSPDRTVNLWPGGVTMDEYLSGFAALDPQLRTVNGLTRSTVYRDTDHVDYRDPGTRDFMKWISEHGGHHHMTAVVLLGGGVERACLSIHYHADDSSQFAVQQARLAALFPALAPAFELGFQRAELVNHAFWDGITAVGDGRAVLLLNERGRIMQLSPAARRLIDARDGLTLKGGILGCDRPADDAKLAEVVGAALEPGGAVARAMRVLRRSGRLPFLITTYPVIRARRMVAPLEAAAIMTIVDPADVPAVRPSLWRSAFALTEREAELARHLAAGHSVESAAANLRMAMPTARTHLRSVFQKTGTDRQSGLLQLLSRVV